MVAKKTTTRKTANKVSTNGRAKKAPTVNGKLTTNERMLVDQISILNHISTRRGFIADYLHDKLDLDQEVGYPNSSQLTVKLFKNFYDREPIAARVVQIMPEESWGLTPEVFETEDAEVNTPFEQAWNDLSLSLLGESKFKRKEGSPIWEYLKRVDTLSGIGFYGILFLGLNDGESNLEVPAERKEGQKLLFMRAFDQSTIEISTYESDPTNPRFGLPTMYIVTFSSPSESVGGIAIETVTRKIHWSRVIHVADNVGSNEVFGVPRMRPVFNRLWDLRKLYGGSAEMYWKGAFPGISLETHPSLGAEVDLNVEKMREMMDDYQSGLQRFLMLNGMNANSLAPQVSDPTPQIAVQLEAICVQLATPKRIFTGSERGELASSQDRITWNIRVQTRQNSYVTPRVIVPFIDRLILLGVLPEPGEEYQVRWPDIDMQTASEKAMVAVQVTDALVKYVAGDVETIMPPLDFFTRVLEMDNDEAEAVLESASENFDEVVEGKLALRNPPPNTGPVVDENIN